MTESCNLNVSRLPNEALTPQNINLPVFNLSCWCGVHQVLEYTPRCLWCLDFFHLAPATRALVAAAFELCLVPPINGLPCMGTCGNLTGHISSIVKPCQIAADDMLEKARCVCTQSMKVLVADCQFCLLGWDRNTSDAVGSVLNGCNGSFLQDVPVYGNASDLPTGASGTKRSIDIAKIILGDTLERLRYSTGETAAPEANNISDASVRREVEPQSTTGKPSDWSGSNEGHLILERPHVLDTPEVHSYEILTLVVGGLICSGVFLLGYAPAVVSSRLEYVD